MKVLIIDNYDSFTYNLCHYCEQVADNVTVVQNDSISVDECRHFDKIILAPGPGLPHEAGITLAVIAYWAGRIPLLGVCLGMQAIATHFGSPLRNLDKVLHGKSNTAEVLFDDPLFKGLPRRIEVGHYHSWVVDERKLSPDLQVTSIDSAGLIMSIRHKKWDVSGVQFHPESVLTPLGMKMLENWLEDKPLP